MTDERRSGDIRLALVEERVAQVLALVQGIDSAMRFPEQSPLGRQLIGRADANAANIRELRTDVDVLESRFTEMSGVVKALRIASLIIGIALSLFALFQVVPK